MLHICELGGLTLTQCELRQIMTKQAPDTEQILLYHAKILNAF